MPSPAWPAAVLSLIACALYIVCSVSTPVWQKVYYLNGEASVSVSNNLATVAGGVNLGVFGYCETGFSLNNIAIASTANPCSSPKVGYYYEPELLGISFTLSDSQRNLFRSATTALILVPVGAGLCGLVFIFSILSICLRSRSMDILAFLISIVALLDVWVSWIGNIVLMKIARSRLASESNGQLVVTLGNALWIQLAGSIVLLLAMCAAGFAICGPYRRDRGYSRRETREQARLAQHQQEQAKLYQPPTTEQRW